MAHIVPSHGSLGELRDRAARIITSQTIIAGSIVEMVHTCGKPGCKCASGQKHRSPYLAVRRKNKRVMISIPRSLEIDVEKSVHAYKELMKLIEALSGKSIDAFITRKKRGG